MPALVNSVEMMDGPPMKPKRLVLCFDGTGNSFTGEQKDTNVVKLYKMCNRSSKDQYHYYQPGIGTYNVDSHDSVNQSSWGKFKSWCSRLLDQGFGTSLDSHVIAGYRFLMRYYNVGDEIYLFGFSRGAFTARFLAAMVYGIGIMSKGNEELVPFAYKIYQDHELGVHSGDKKDKHSRMMADFKDTFCLPHVQVHFLGLFDTVRSVGTFDVGGRSFIPVSKPFAKFVRHAVSLDERRGKFKAALLCQNDDGNHTAHTMPNDPNCLDIFIRERWFAGNHGDVGGGWEIEEDATHGTSPLQLSDIALEWLLREIRELPEEMCRAGKLDLNEDKVNRFQSELAKGRKQALQTKLHDVLKYGGGLSWFKTFMWNILEYSPFSSRLELNKQRRWVVERWHPNRGGTRDLPLCAVLDSSIFERQALVPGYKPTNDNFDSLCNGKRWD